MVNTCELPKLSITVPEVVLLKLVGSAVVNTPLEGTVCRASRFRLVAKFEVTVGASCELEICSGPGEVGTTVPLESTP